MHARQRRSQGSSVSIKRGAGGVSLELYCAALFLGFLGGRDSGWLRWQKLVPVFRKRLVRIGEPVSRDAKLNRHHTPRECLAAEHRGTRSSSVRSCQILLRVPVAVKSEVTVGWRLRHGSTERARCCGGGGCSACSGSASAKSSSSAQGSASGSGIGGSSGSASTSASGRGLCSAGFQLFLRLRCACGIALTWLLCSAP